LLLQINGSNIIPESNTDNDTLAVPITLDVRPPDLAPIALQVSALLDAPVATAVWGVTNVGPGSAALSFGSSWYDGLWLSTNSSADGIFAFINYWLEAGPIPAGGSYWRTNTFTVPPEPPGTYYLIFEADSSSQLPELSLSNNFIARPVAINLKSPDLVPITLEVPSTITAPPYPVVQVSWAVTNQGPGNAFPSLAFGGWGDALSISTNATTDGIVSQVGQWTETNSLPAGQEYHRTVLVSLPVAKSGNYYLIFVANEYGLTEANHDNNVLAVPFTFNAQFPDLGISSWQAPTQIVGQPWPSMTFVVGITNEGHGAARGNPYWTDSLYLSQTAFFGGQTILLRSWFQSNSVAAGSMYWQTNTVIIPITDSADYYLIFVADDFNSLGEQQLENNTVISPLSLNLSPPPDLAVDTFQVPALVISTATPNITLVSHVINQGLGVATGTWTDVVSVTFSTGSIYPAPNRQLVLDRESLTLLPGEGYWRTNVITMPEMISGRYWLSYLADSSYSLFDADFGNNIATSEVDFNLTAPGPPRLGQAFLLRNGWFEIFFYGSFGSTFALQVSSNLIDWESLYLFSCTATPMVLTDPPANGATSRFYRVVTPPPTGSYIPLGPPTPP
jgi:hypothetical protein